MQLSDLATLTLDTRWAGQKSEEDSWRNAQDVVSILGATRQVASITTSDIDRVTGTLRRRGLKNATCNRKLAALSTMLKVAARRGLIESMPFIDMAKEEKRTRVLTRSEEVGLFDALPARSQPLFRFLLETGMRVSEALSLRLVSDGAAYLEDTKSGKSRTVPLTAKARDAWRQGWDGVNQNRVNHDWNHARGALGLQTDRWFTPHCLRHTCATRLLDAGVDIRVVKEWLGHSDISITQRYVHVSKRHLMDAVSKLEAL